MEPDYLDSFQSVCRHETTLLALTDDLEDGNCASSLIVLDLSADSPDLPAFQLAVLTVCLTAPLGF